MAAPPASSPRRLTPLRRSRSGGRGSVVGLAIGLIKAKLRHLKIQIRATKAQRTRLAAARRIGACPRPRSGSSSTASTGRFETWRASSVAPSERSWSSPGASRSITSRRRSPTTSKRWPWAEGAMRRYLTARATCVPTFGCCASPTTSWLDTEAIAGSAVQRHLEMYKIGRDDPDRRRDRGARDRVRDRPRRGGAHRRPADARVRPPRGRSRSRAPARGRSRPTWASI